MAFSKIILNGTTLMDVTGDTVDSNNLLSGETATKNDGTQVTGSYTPSSITVNPLSVTNNGTYTAPTGTAYSPVTVNVSGGGSSEAPEICAGVQFIDYDGRRVETWETSTVAGKSALPSFPSNTGLTARGWNWSLADIKAMMISQPNSLLTVGVEYDTTSGATEIDCTFPAESLHPYLGICVNGTVEIDWGDGGAVSTLTGSSDSTLIYADRVYSASGDYTIKISATSGRYTIQGTANDYNTSILFVGSNNSNDWQYSACINAVRCGEDCYIGLGAFSNCVNLKTVTLPAAQNITALDRLNYRNLALLALVIPAGISNYTTQYSWYYSLQMKYIALAKTMLNISLSAFQQSAIKAICVHDGVTTLGSYAVAYCSQLPKIIIPTSLTSVATYALSNNWSMRDLEYNANIGNNYLFYQCFNLLNVSWSEGMESVGTYFFNQCRTVNKLTVPSTVTNLGRSCFSTMSGLKELHFKRATPPTAPNSDCFSNLPTTCIIYVPTGSLSAYTTASNYPSSATYTYIEE